ncbi:MAG TPA: hypothetical protein VGP25_15770 [Gemmatimonadaceae bacterium]|jgi:hypothetical protein|nr:hypothetical protein [Gemmatimonadaceae bacterium]
MLRRSLTALSLLALAAAPLAAQGANDPTKKVEGSAPLPAGWSGRTDHASDKLTDAKFVKMGTGFHVTSGPAAIYWSASQSVKGPFTASTTITQTKAPAHPEAYGIFFGGKGLDNADQSYFYFLVRGDGKFLVNHRAGTEVHKLTPWTDNAAVKKQDASGKATNTLTVDASKPDSVRLLVNGSQVTALKAPADGVVGLRVNHNLDVHISDFKVTPKQ